ncbi:Cyclin-dependent kinase regulatory subunit [Cooperia oncophora]
MLASKTRSLNFNQTLEELALYWAEQQGRVMTTGQNDFYYSNKYEDDEYEYRHVHVTKEVAKLIPKNRLISHQDGWCHYMIHGPERHVLLFRRPLPNKNNVAGKNSTQAQEPAAASTETQKSIDAKNTEVMESNEEDDFLAKLHTFTVSTKACPKYWEMFIETTVIMLVAVKNL